MVSTTAGLARRWAGSGGLHRDPSLGGGPDPVRGGSLPAGGRHRLTPRLPGRQRPEELLQRSPLRLPRPCLRSSCPQEFASGFGDPFGRVQLSPCLPAVRLELLRNSWPLIMSSDHRLGGRLPLFLGLSPARICSGSGLCFPG